MQQSFEKLIQLMNESLYGKHVRGVLNSIGSNIFLDIGYDIKVPQEDRYRKEWVFWISWSSWRITKNDLYVVGSGDHRDDIHLGINYLMEKKVQNVYFTSSYLDLQIEFDDGYTLSTFFNRVEEYQWLIFMPDGNSFSVDFSNTESIQELQSFSRDYISKKKTCDTLIQEDSVIENAHIDKDDRLVVSLKNSHEIYFYCNAWRIECNEKYVIGCVDEDPKNFDYLKGCNLQHIRVENEFVDSEITLDKGYSIQTFACCAVEHQWSIRNREPFFHGNIKLANLFNL